jgi:hypothetical protein
MECRPERREGPVAAVALFFPRFFTLFFTVSFTLFFTVFFTLFFTVFFTPQFFTIAHAQPAPFHRYRTLDTKHFHVHTTPDLEREGRVAAAAAERAYTLLASELKTPRGTIDLVVTDDADYSNGYATAWPSNRIVVFATPPIEGGGLRLNEDWLGLVITHELAHIFHLDRATGIWGVAQKIFGRGPGLFPNTYGPAWFTEGLAVYYESRFTQGGRLKDAEHVMLARTAAREHRLPQLGDLSLGSGLFPGGSGAYAYGSLFVDFLSRTYGDTNVRRFVDGQSRALIPWRLNGLSRAAFGVPFGTAFTAWRDSVERTSGAYEAPLPGWRELTRHGYYALDPRWLNDSTLVYAANDGRSTPAEYALSLNGDRRRVGRRNSLGPNVPWPGGGLLFSQLDLTSPSEARADLYVDRDGTQTRLTTGLRLVQPDVRNDGHIVAVQIAATRSSLLLLDSTARQRRLLRDAGPDETWSEPRWSPDGRAIAVVHRTHGGVFSIDVIDVANGVGDEVERGRYILSSPSWTRDGQALFFTSEESGTPVLVQRQVASQARPVGSATIAQNVYSSESSPNGALLAASTLRADGYHVGVAPMASLVRTTIDDALLVDSLARRDTQALAAGQYHRYSAWRSLVPRYWYPVLEEAPNRGTRFGFTTEGRDVLGRHIYDLSAALTGSGKYQTASLTYRFAGLRRPYIDVSLDQDYTRELSLVNGGTQDTIGTLLRRTQFASLATTFVRPRVRTYSALSFGVAIEQRDFRTDPPEFLKQQPSTYSRIYDFPSAFISGSWSNTQRPSLSISAEDGISLAFTARERTLRDSVRQRASGSLIGTASMYKSLDLPGFAHHVLALRLAGGIADRRASSAFQVGGTSGGTIAIIPSYTIGEGRRTFGVRGFPGGSITGTRAAAGSFEYRAPLKLGGRGLGGLPLFFDRASMSLFADAAVATCATSPVFTGVCSSRPRIGRTIASVGAELVPSAAIFDWDSPQQLRFGVAVPVAGREVVGARRVSVHLAYGLSF